MNFKFLLVVDVLNICDLNAKYYKSVLFICELRASKVCIHLSSSSEAGPVGLSEFQKAS
jgi:hypothetical protein